MAFAALIPLITSALSAAQSANKTSDTTGSGGNSTLPSLEPEEKQNWAGFTLPKDNNPLASSYEKAMAILSNRQKSNDELGGQNG